MVTIFMYALLFFVDIKSLINSLALEFPYHRLLGFDFNVDEEGKLKLFEVNNLYIGIINQQMNTGPLFGRFTDEVIDFCRRNRKTVAFNFKI